MTRKLRDPGPPIGSGRRAESIELAEETAIIRREDTRRALLAKAGLVAGGVGIATLARPGSAEASTVSGQELGWNNVKDDQFAGGATGDGHTDDAPAIQAALNASGGPKLTYFPPGTYLCGSTLRLGSNAHLLGVPGQSIIKAGAPPDLDPGLDISSPLVDVKVFNTGGSNGFAQTNVTVQDLVFDGNSANRPYVDGKTIPFLVRFFSTERLKIIGCELRNQDYGLLAFAGCNDVTAQGLRFRNWGIPLPPPGTTRTPGGFGLWMSGNSSGGDAVPTSRVRIYDLDFAEADWTAILCYARDFVIDNVTIQNTHEGGIFTKGAQTGQAEHVVAQDGVVSNFTVKGVRFRDKAACGFEGGGRNIGVRNFVISDTDDAGVKINWPSDNVTVENGVIFDTAKDGTNFPDYGQVTLFQTDGFTNRDVTVRNVTVGKPGLNPVATYAVRVNALDTQNYESLHIIGNNLRNGYGSQPIFFNSGVLKPDDPVSRIAGNLGHSSQWTHVQELQLTSSTQTVTCGFPPSVIRIHSVVNATDKLLSCAGTFRRGSPSGQFCQTISEDALGRVGRAIGGAIIRFRNARDNTEIFAAKVLNTIEDGFVLSVFTDSLSEAPWLLIEAEP